MTGKTKITPKLTSQHLLHSSCLEGDVVGRNELRSLSSGSGHPSPGRSFIYKQTHWNCAIIGQPSPALPSPAKPSPAHFTMPHVVQI